MAGPDSAESSVSERAAFLGGILAAGVPLLLVIVYLIAAVGPAAVRRVLPGGDRIVDLPSGVLADLVAAEAVVSNADNPTGARPHDTLLVIPDDELLYRLRPGASIRGHVLRTLRPVYLDPPSLYLPAGWEPTARVAAYIAENARLSYAYSVDEAGFRRTLPAVQAERAVLMVGDSVMFGVGVADEYTPASTLQARLGGRARVVNAGVGGYQAWQSLRIAEREASRARYDALVYLTSLNDFAFHRDETPPSTPEAIVPAFAELAPRFGGRVILVVVPYLEMVGAEFLLDAGWKPERVEEGRALYRQLPELAARAGLEYVDWLEIQAEFREASGTVFGPFALFADHAHLSRLGSEWTARRVAAALGPPFAP